MRRLFAVVCVGAILVAALVPGAVAVCTPLFLCDDLTFLPESRPLPLADQPFVSPALVALAVSHHLPRASLLDARS